MKKQSSDDDATGSAKLHAAPGRAPRGLERLATGCLKAKAEDSRLGDLSEQYVRTHDRVRAVLGESSLAMGLARLAADLRYLFSAADVMLFARAADPLQPVAVTNARETVALDIKERAMTLVHAGARKLVLPALLLVGAAFLINGAANVWTTWRETEALIVDLQREKAKAIALEIDQFIASIQDRIAWTSTVRDAESKRLSPNKFVILMRQVPPITEIIQLDAEGKEVRLESRVRMSARSSGRDYSADVRFTEATKHQKYVGPVLFRKNTEPYVSLAVANVIARSGVTLADVNLKRVWEIIQTAKGGETGYAYLVDREGRLIAHPDIGLVLQKTDLSTLPQVAAALAATPSRTQGEGTTFDDSPSGEPVVSVNAAVPATGWKVFVELPLTEAQAPLWAALIRVASLLALGILAILLASVVAARRDVPAQPART